jgi:cation diffusion facilitator family transporter
MQPMHGGDHQHAGDGHTHGAAVPHGAADGGAHPPAPRADTTHAPPADHSHTHAPGEDTSHPPPEDHSHTQGSGADASHPHPADHSHTHRSGEDDGHAPQEDHSHTHAPGAEHGHDHGESKVRRVLGYVPILGALFHGHNHGAEMADRALDTSERGIRAVWLSLVGLLATALLQVAIVAISGCAALLADSIHNFADALTAIPLWLAYTLGRRPPTRRYTYGFGRAEDLAGVIVVLMILGSAVAAGYESWRRLFAPQPVEHLGWVAFAAVVGFLGNEAIAQFRIREGEAIGSAALVADGHHARADGLTSLAVLVGAGGVWLGYPLADPLVGLLITIAILAIGKDAALTMWYRLMDAVDPALLDRIEATARGVPGVQGVVGTRVRWLGHRLQAELHVLVDESLSTRDSHEVAEAVRHALFHALPRLGAITVHVDPCTVDGATYHTTTAHHAAAELAQPPAVPHP